MLRYTLVDEKAQKPTVATFHSVGYDLYSSQDTIIAPGSLVEISTGVAVEIADGHFGRLFATIDVAKEPVIIKSDIIKPGSFSIVKCSIFNLHPTKDFVIEKGCKIAQLVIQEYSLPSLVEFAKSTDAESYNE